MQLSQHTQDLLWKLKQEGGEVTVSEPEFILNHAPTAWVRAGSASGSFFHGTITKWISSAWTDFAACYAVGANGSPLAANRRYLGVRVGTNSGQPLYVVEDGCCSSGSGDGDCSAELSAFLAWMFVFDY